MAVALVRRWPVAPVAAVNAPPVTSATSLKLEALIAPELFSLAIHLHQFTVEQVQDKLAELMFAAAGIEGEK